MDNLINELKTQIIDVLNLEEMTPEDIKNDAQQTLKICCAAFF